MLVSMSATIGSFVERYVDPERARAKLEQPARLPNEWFEEGRRADHASVLCDLGEYEEALRVLGGRPPTTPVLGTHVRARSA
jgi:hypothetical protein